jgi:hypothetical protein
MAQDLTCRERHLKELLTHGATFAGGSCGVVCRRYSTAGRSPCNASRQSTVILNEPPHLVCHLLTGKAFGQSRYPTWL